MADAIIFQQPDHPQQLLLLLHGYGADAASLAPLGERLAQAFPHACIVSLAGFESAEAGNGQQWFSLNSLNEATRPARIAAMLPRLAETVRAWQARMGVSREATALIGFSQGAIVALESTRQASPLAGRVVAMAGRYGTLPDAAPVGTTLHLLHGKEDPVVPYAHTVLAAERLVQLGADVTADVVPFVGHELDDAVVALLIKRLTTYVPMRLWDQAMQAAAQLDHSPPQGS